MMYRAAFVHEQSVLVVDVFDKTGRLSDMTVGGTTWRGLRWPRRIGWRPQEAWHRWFTRIRVAPSPLPYRSTRELGARAFRESL